MLRTLALLPAAGLFVLAHQAAAEPPSGAKPLSEILKTVEGESGFSHFREIEWDDAGHWEIEYATTDGSEKEIEVDALNGTVTR